MGLDMYAFRSTKLGLMDEEVDFPAMKDAEELAYWRKFNHLHGWMEKLYRAKGGQEESFNCVGVRLDNDDLDQLEKDLKVGLPFTPGFFFGGPDVYPDHMEMTKEFISKARDALEHEYGVYYYSWW